MTDDLAGAEHGELLARLVDAGMPTERLVVDRADQNVLAAGELVDDWRSLDRSRHVRLRGDGAAVEFGTPDEGVGVVMYRIRDEDSRHWFQQDLVLLTRMDMALVDLDVMRSSEK